jgi:hypothetical protein
VLTKLFWYTSFIGIFTDLLFLARSSWSRAELVMEVGDLNEKESMNYLISKSEAKAKRLYELVGGRIVELKKVADEPLAEKSLEGMFRLTLKI